MSAHQRWRLGVLAWSLAGSAGVVSAIILIVWLVQGSLEITRTCTNGYPNACSFLYGACWRLIKGFGYLRGITYTKDSELGASVRAAGWVAEGWTKGREWHCRSRPRDPAKYELSDRIRWEIRAAAWSADLEPRPTIPVDRASTIPGQLELAA